MEAKIRSTGETVTKLIKNQDVDMTLEEMQARMKELAYLKIQIECSNKKDAGTKHYLSSFRHFTDDCADCRFA